MTNEEFDPSLYVRPPILDSAGAIALGTALLSAQPKDVSDAAKRAAKKLRKETGALQAAWAKADAAIPVTDRRVVDTRVDNAWGRFLDRLEAYATLPASAFPRAARARELVDRISPERAWLKLRYDLEWAESDKRLRRIDDEGLAVDCHALAGPEFLAEVRAAHDEYGRIIGIKAPVAAPETVALAEPLRAVVQAIARYSRAIIGDLDEDDADSVARTRAALRPIDDLRAGQSRRTAATRGEEEPAPAPAPAPAPPADPKPPTE